MNVKRIIEDCFTDTEHRATIAFRLSEEQKTEFVDFCNTNNISIGRLMRALLREFMENAKHVDIQRKQSNERD